MVVAYRCGIVVAFLVAAFVVAFVAFVVAFVAFVVAFVAFVVAFCCGIHPDTVVAFVPTSSWHHRGIRWGFMASASLHPRQISHAPPGMQACTFDIKAFHRTCPVLPDHKPFLVVQFNGKFLLDHCYPFGAHPASSNAGQICRAAVDIWNTETVEDADIKGYEDNLSSLQFPNTDSPFHEGAHRY
jgi:hypothetical protein